MGASGSTLDGDGSNSSNNNHNGSNGGDALGDGSIGAPGGSTKVNSNKHSLKRRQRAQAQQNISAEQGVGLDDGLHRLQQGGVGPSNTTPSASVADLLAPPGGSMMAMTTDSMSSVSHFGSLTASAVESVDLSGLTSKSSNAAFMGRYTPFPLPPSQMLTPASQLHPTQPPSSFSSAAKPLLADPRGDQNGSSQMNSEFGVDARTLVVLHDYENKEARTPVSLRHGDALHFIADRGDYVEVCLPDVMPESGASFLVPQDKVMKCRSLDAFPWYHGRVSRAEAERLLSSGIDGTFLVRESESSPGQLSVSLRSGQRVHHYRLTIDAGLWFLSPEWRFRTVPHLVRHHSRHPDGLACPLLYPAPRLSLRSQTPPVAAGWKPGDCLELDRTDLRVMRRLGGGQYGEVYEAVWLSRNAKVAVKTLRLDCAMGEIEFLEEAGVMNALKHRNLVKLLGVVSRERPFYIVTEFMSYGNLQDFLRSRQNRPDGVNLLPIVPVLLRFAVDVAAAMEYLEKQHFIHRDLAARNCLVTEELGPGEPGFASTGRTDRLVVKVGDFGLARLVGGAGGKGASTEAAYTANATGQFPIKWTAPEGLAYQRFSTKSDVWAFGILLWEIVTYGASPYPSVELSGVYALLERGYRMEKPPDCPNEVYQMMRDCWRWEAVERPSFLDLKNRLTSFLETGDANGNSEHQQNKSTDRFYEQLSTTLGSNSLHMAPPPPQRPHGTEVSTFVVQPSSFNLEPDRPRSGSLSSPSPSKAALNPNGNNNNGNIARCRPHNFSFRPNGTSIGSNSGSAGKLSAPPSAEHPAPVSAAVVGPNTPRSCSGDSLLGDSTGFKRGSSDNKTQQDVLPSNQSHLRQHSNSSTSNSASSAAVAANNSLLVTPGRGYGSLNPGAASVQPPASTPGLPPKPTGDIGNRVTAELAEQMRKRRALAEQDQSVAAAAEKQPPATASAATATALSGSTNSLTVSDPSTQQQASTAGKNNALPTANITLQRHSTDPIAGSRATGNGLSAAAQSRQAGNANGAAATQPLVSGDGRPVAPVKPCLRRLQGDYSPTSAVVQPSPAMSRTQASGAILLRGPSPTNSNTYTAPGQIVNATSASSPPSSSSVNWTWDDVHRLCQLVMGSLVDDNAMPAAMTMSTMGRLPTPTASPIAGQLGDLAAALDSLADSLPPRSRFQVRQLVIAIRQQQHSSTSSASSSSINISSAQINNVLNLIPPPSLLTTSSSSISTSSSINGNNGSSSHESTDQLAIGSNSTNNGSTSSSSSNNKAANLPSPPPPTQPPALPAGVLC